MKKTQRKQPNMAALNNPPAVATTEGARPKITRVVKREPPPPMIEDDDAGLEGDGGKVEKKEQPKAPPADRGPKLFDAIMGVVAGDVQVHGPINPIDARDLAYTFIKFLFGAHNDPLVILNFYWMLNPANMQTFTRMHPTTYKALVVRAAELIADANADTPPELIAHWRRIAGGGYVPFGWKIMEEKKPDGQR